MLEANTDQTTLQIINALLSLLNDRFLYILCKMLEANFFSLFPLEEELWKLCRQPGSKGH